MTARETIGLEERNGFTLIEITPAEAVASLYAWRPPEPLDAIANLQPRANTRIALS